MRSIELQAPDNEPLSSLSGAFLIPGAHRLGNGSRVPGQLGSIAESLLQASPFDGLFVRIRSPVSLDPAHFRHDMRSMEADGMHFMRS